MLSKIVKYIDLQYDRLIDFRSKSFVKNAALNSTNAFNLMSYKNFAMQVSKVENNAQSDQYCPQNLNPVKAGKFFANSINAPQYHPNKIIKHQDKEQYVYSSKFEPTQGRAQRSEYFPFIALYIVSLTIIIAFTLFLDHRTNGAMAFLSIVPISSYMIAAALTAPYLIIRRLHDIGLSGWYFIAAIIPIIGLSLLLMLALAPSQHHANKYGPVPADS